MKRKFKEFFDRTTVLALVVTMLFSVMPTQAGALAGLNATVDRFVLVDPVTNAELYTIVDGGYINLASLTDSSKVNIKAETSGPGLIGSVWFDLDAGAYTRNENVAPYALFGDSPAYNYSNGTLSLGVHTLEAIPRSGLNNTGVSGTGLDISFTVVNDTAKPTAAVTSPAVGTSLSGGFAVCGTSSDDTKVDNVQVRFQDPNSWSYINNGFKTYPNISGNWCVNVNGTSGNNIPDGIWGIRLVVTDIWGNSFNNLKFAPYTIDNVNPAGTITGPTNGHLVINDSITQKGFVGVTGTATDALSGIDTTKGEAKIRTLEKKTNGARVAETSWVPITFVGSDFASGLIETTGLPSRDDYEVAVVVYDKAGNSKWLWPRPVIEVDNTSPVVSIDNPLTGYINGTVDVKATLVDDNPSHYYLKVETLLGSLVYQTTNYNYSELTNEIVYSWDTVLNSFGDGDYKVILTARDLANNKDGGGGTIGDSYKETIVTVDNTDPSSDQTALNKIELYNGKITNTDVKMELEASDAGVGLGYIEYRVTKNGTPLVGSPFQVLGASAYKEFSDEGVYEIRYHAVDGLGNSEPEKTIAFTIDKTAPVITLSGDNPLTLTQGTAYVEPGYSANKTVTWDVVSTVDVNTVGSYTVTYEAMDTAGNIETETRTVNVVAPVLPAGAVALAATGGPEEGAEVAGETNESQSGEVQGGLNEQNDDESSDNDGAAGMFGVAWYWWLIILVLATGGSYWYFGTRRSKR